MDREALNNNKDDGQNGLSTFRFTGDTQGDILEGEIAFTLNGSRTRDAYSSDDKVAVMTSLNGLGKEERALFPDDPEMQEHVIMSKIRPVGQADQDVPFGANPQGIVTNDLAVRAGVLTLPAWRDMPNGVHVKVVVRHPDDADTQMNPNKMDPNKVVLRLEPIEAGGETFARTLEMNMRHYLKSPGNYERGFDMRYPQTIARINAIQSLIHQVLMSFFTTAKALGIDNFTINVPGNNPALQGNKTVEELASMLGVVSTRTSRQNPEMVNSLRQMCLRSAFLNASDVFSHYAYGFDGRRQQAVSAESQHIDGTSVFGQLLTHQLQAQKKMYAALAEFLRLEEQHMFGRIIKDDIAGGVIDTFFQ